ncbi:MAG: ASCH domain-containing protein [Rhodospirillaceae bacterium]|jgi:uncharacterized protein YhfF|nr:ASCH domain-containing protein [Rhodospirillaceae bacterium]
MIYLPDGPERPNQAALDAFWTEAKVSNPEIGDEYQVRWFGIDVKTTRGIFGYIKEGVKTATYTVPWILEQEGVPLARAGDYIVLIDYDGTPAMLLRIGKVEAWKFEAIDERVTHTDGSSVRDPNVWKLLHKAFWNSELKQYGLKVTDDMPVLVEHFERVFDKV